MNEPLRTSDGDWAV